MRSILPVIVAVACLALAGSAHAQATAVLDAPSPAYGPQLYGNSPTDTSVKVEVTAAGLVKTETTPASGTTQAVDLTKVGGSTHSATVPVHARLTDGSASYVGAKTGQLPAALGSTTSAGSVSVTLSSDHAALPLPTGAATEATLSAASAKLPAALGATTSAASLSVVPATDATTRTKPATCATFAVGRVSADQTADTIGGLASRSWVRVTNSTVLVGADPIECGPTGVTFGTGEPLDVGQSVIYEVGTAAVQCITDAGNAATVGFFECAY